MKVAYVAPEGLPIPPVKGGSVQIYLNELLRTLKHQSAVNTILISPSQSGQAYVPSRQNQHVHIRVRAKTTAQYQQRVLQELQRAQPDIVQIENRPKFALRVKRTLHCPVVLNLHSTTFLGPQHINAKERNSVLKKMDVVIVNSHYLRRAIESRARLKPADWNARVIHPGIRLSRFRYQLRHGGPFHSRRPLRLLFVGRIIQQKGVHELIRSVRKLKDIGYPVSLTLVGKTPPWESQYGQHARRLAKRYPIQFAGFVPQSKLPEYYAKHDILVCPSQQNEAFGLVNLEALSSGLPVIASRVGGIPEIVTSTCGILVDTPRRPNAFSAAIIQCLNQPRQIENKSKGARIRARKFTWQRTARQFAHIYQTL